MLRRADLIAEELSTQRRRQVLGRALTGLIPYALAFVSPSVTLAICAAVAVFYAQPFAGGLEAPVLAHQPKGA